MGLSTGDNISRVGRGYRPMAEINVTPMVDVMLVLLIIFMVTSPMMISGVGVDLPKTKAIPLTISEEPLNLRIRANGDIYLQDTKIQPNQITTRLKAVSKENTDVRIVISADKRLDYGQVMKTVGAISAAGFTKVALITDGNQ